MFGVIFVCGNLLLQIAGKTAKLAKIRISGHALHAALRVNVFISVQ